MKNTAIIYAITGMFLLSSCSFPAKHEAEKQEASIRATVESAGQNRIDQGMTVSDAAVEGNSDSILLEESGTLMVKKGRINEVFCFLPGYKKIPADKEKINAELEQVFTHLEKAEKRVSADPLA